MEGINEDELLSLRLAIVIDSSRDSSVDYVTDSSRDSSVDYVIDSSRERKLKRKVRDAIKPLKSNEGKMLSLFQIREQMLKQDLKRKEGIVEDGKGLQLIQSLLLSATSLDENKLDNAVDNLIELYQNVSLTGDSVQRVAAYFADALVARLLTRRSPFYEMIMEEPTPENEFMAYMDLYKVSPYFQFAHFTANQAIFEAFEKEEETNGRALHVVDLDVSYGFQWPSLMQSLSEKATSGNQISLRITGYGKSLEELQETETRLVTFAKTFRNLTFEFQGLLRGSRLKNLRKRKNETVAINLVFYLNTLCSFTHISETLKSLHSLNPSIMVLVEQEGGRSPRSFLSRFMEFLHYYAAMFDSLDDFLPLESLERLTIEKNHLGKEIKRLLNYNENEANCLKYERMETWKGRMESHGFSEVKLSSKSILQAKLLLKIKGHSSCPNQFGLENGGFSVYERDNGSSISLSWQDKSLVTASAWRCAR